MYLAMLMFPYPSSLVCVCVFVCVYVCVCVCVFVIFIYVFGHAYVSVLILSRMYVNACVSSHSALSHNPHLPNPSFLFFIFIYLHMPLCHGPSRVNRDRTFRKKKVFLIFLFFSVWTA
jgi:hypothetical protein